MNAQKILRSSTEEKLLTAREIGCALNIGASTVYAMAHKKRIPGYRVGETGIRFRLSEVLAALHRPAVRHDAR
jgi:excisionase family DNA binding protein